MKIEVLSPRVDYQLDVLCPSCGRQTRYSEMTLAEYNAIKHAVTVCDPCRAKLGFRDGSANAESPKPSEEPEKSANP